MTSCADRRRPTSRPISRRCEDMRFSATLLEKSGSRDSGTPSGCHGGVYRIPAARFPAPPSRVSKGVSGENGVGELTTCAGRRGPASESRPAHRSPDFGPMRKSTISGDTVGGISGSGNCFPTSPSRVLQGVSSENGVRKLTNCADRRGSAFESHPIRGRRENLRFLATLFGGIRKSGFRDLVRMSWGRSIGFWQRVF